jgi:hypothetical protein
MYIIIVASGKAVEKNAVHKTDIKPTIPAADLKELNSVQHSVGIIHGYKLNGTVFRVGKDKVMTAWHVVRGMLCKFNTLS